MGRKSQPRRGSLQFWPRKRAEKAIPRVNWSVVPGEGMLGVLGYKAGMGTVLVRDKTDKSLTANKKIAIPVTILELPKHKIYSVRFYKHGIIAKETIVSQDQELKRIVRVPKQLKTLENVEGSEIRVLMYPVMKGMFKKTPTMVEVAVRGANAFESVKALVGKEISAKELLKWPLVDVRGLTTGKGLVGPVKRFGVSLKANKTEKGTRRPGSLGPWHPARVIFRVAQAGQLGMFSRVHYNLKVVSTGDVKDNAMLAQRGFPHYGLVTGEYVMLVGSVQGTPKREILITPALRATKKQAKKNYELLEVLK